MSNPAPGFKSNPQKSITITPHTGEVVVRAGDTVIARSSAAKTLRESPYPADVIYVPFSDIDFSKLTKTTTSTHCPFKGDASYWSVADGGQAGVKDAMWAYETPFDEMAEIKDHGAFYPNKVTIEAVEAGSDPLSGA